MTVKLSYTTLKDIGSGINTPSYQPSDLSPGIVHVGVGNFHRAHQAYYLHRLFEMGVDRDWAIIGAGIKHFDAAMRDRLQPQDWLTTVVELDPAQYSATISGSIIDFLAIEPRALIDTMTDPDIRIVSLTVTEGGYFVDAETGLFNQSDPEIVADAQQPDSPKTVFGIIIAALMQRRAAGIPPFTVMSCDNLPENGHMAEQAVLGLSATRSDDARDWIAQHVAFPNSMVDCITPATGDRERAIVRDKFGIVDAAPVVCEPFRQWVLEDKFSNGRPALEKVGVEFVEDVASYELMKLRILNGGHASIAYAAALLDIQYVHEAMQDRRVAGFFDKLAHDEVIPTLPAIAGVSFEAYYQKIVERFSNEAIGDTIVRLCFDGFNRQPKFILPAIEQRLASGQPVVGLALTSALWCRYCYGTSDRGHVIVPNDPHWDRLNEQAKSAKVDPPQWLGMTDVYGSLSENKVFVNAFCDALNALWRDGVAATLDSYQSSTTHK